MWSRKKHKDGKKDTEQKHKVGIIGNGKTAFPTKLKLGVSGRKRQEGYCLD